MVSVVQLLLDYLRGCRYAFSRPWRAERDQGLNQNAVASMACFVIAAVGTAAILRRGDALWNFLWVLLLVGYAIAQAAVVVNRYRHRDEPEVDRLGSALERVGTRIGDWLADRREGRRSTK